MQLEIGCGYDRSLNVDVACDVIRTPETDLLSDAHNLPFRESVFKSVKMFEVLEHLQNPTQALKEIRRILTPKGKLCFSIPNTLFIGVFFRWFTGLTLKGSPEHINAWRFLEISNLLRRNGFTITYYWFDDTHFHSNMRKAKFLRILPSRLSKHALFISSTLSELRKSVR